MVVALRTVRMKEEDPRICPRCNHDLIIIDGNLTKWLTCSSCKWKKLTGKDSGQVIQVKPLGELQPEKLT
jgi:ssDNA-binding Zn-finger/Zn-ribbon topoisomerase 1